MIVRQFFMAEGRKILVAVDKPPEDKPVVEGTELRCGGLIWKVLRVVDEAPPATVGYELEGDSPLRPGMRLRRAVDPMPDDEYQMTQHKVLMIAAFAREIDCDGFLEKIEAAHAVGPMLDPTSYRAAMGRLEVIQKTAFALLQFQRKLPTYAEALKADQQADAALKAAGR